MPPVNVTQDCTTLSNDTVQMFDSQKQTLLRQLKGHQRPVHTTRFAPDKMHVLSGSDDATVSTNIPFTVHAGCCKAHRDQWESVQVACKRWCMLLQGRPCLSTALSGRQQHSRYCDYQEGMCHSSAEAWTARVQVRWWDITAGEQLFRLDGHTDYIRSSACSPSSPDTWATGISQ